MSFDAWAQHHVLLTCAVLVLVLVHARWAPPRRCCSQDLLFLRNLVLDGRWEDAQAFVKPFAAKPAAAEAGFDVGKVMFALRRQKFLELLGGGEARPEVMELVDGLKQLEPHCSKEEFNNLCYCLTLTTLTGELARGLVPRAWDGSRWRGRVTCARVHVPHRAPGVPGLDATHWSHAVLPDHSTVLRGGTGASVGGLRVVPNTRR